MQYIPTAEGFYDFTENRYIYPFKDHLGNTRLSYANNTETNTLEILDKNDYYPFGMNHLNPDAGSFFGQGSYKNHKYNGKELQETGMYDYGWRMYMPDIGRWNAMDQLSENYMSHSPYAYVMNNPVMMTDPDGRQHRFAQAPEYSPVDQGTPHNYWHNIGRGNSNGLSGIGGGYGGSTSSYNTLTSWSTDSSYEILTPLLDSWINQGYEFKINSKGNLYWWSDDKITGIQNDIQGSVGHIIKFYEPNTNYPAAWHAQGSDNEFFGDGLSFIDKHFNGGLGIAGAAVQGYNKIPNDIKRHYAYKLSKITGVKSGKIFQGAKGFANTAGKWSKTLGPVGTILGAGVITYEVISGDWNAHTAVNASLMIGAGIATISGAPVVLTGIAIYGVGDYFFDFGDVIDRNIGRDSGLWKP